MWICPGQIGVSQFGEIVQNVQHTLNMFPGDDRRELGQMRFDWGEQLVGIWLFINLSTGGQFIDYYSLAKLQWMNSTGQVCGLKPADPCAIHLNCLLENQTKKMKNKKGLTILLGKSLNNASASADSSAIPSDIGTRKFHRHKSLNIITRGKLFKSEKSLFWSTVDKQFRIILLDYQCILPEFKFICFSEHWSTQFKVLLNIKN